LLEIGQAAKLLTRSSMPSELKIISYNIRWRGVTTPKAARP
jgi:hypothetical protein